MDNNTTGFLLYVEPIDDGATPAGLALTQYNLINSSDFTPAQKDVLRAFVACNTGFRPYAHDQQGNPLPHADGSVPDGVTNGKPKAEKKK